MTQADEPSLPGAFQVAVLMERRPGATRWQPFTWTVAGLVAGEVAASSKSGPVAMPSGDGIRRTLWRGYEVALHADEAESYYFNLMSASPQAFVVVRYDEDGQPSPDLVTLCFDEANAYSEGDEELHNVPMPPELAKWLEAFVIAHYVPEKRIKRKRRPWIETK
jgi:hypothetical protein